MGPAGWMPRPPNEEPSGIRITKATQREINELTQGFFTFVPSTKEASNGRAPMLVKGLEGFLTAIAPCLGNFVVVGERG